MTITAITPVTLAIEYSATGTDWKDLDLSAYVPASATGVLLRLRRTGGTSSTGYSLRPKGATWVLASSLLPDCICTRAVQLGTGRTIQTVLAGDATNLFEVQLTGYTESETVWLNPPVDLGGVASTDWTDRDISAHTGSDDALGVICSKGNTQMAVRPKGSTDDLYNLGQDGDMFIIGLDENKVFQTKQGTTSAKTYLHAYMRRGVVMYTNRPDASLGSTGTWQDLPVTLPVDPPSERALMAFIHVRHSAQIGTYFHGLRARGDTATITGGTYWMAWEVIPCDSAGKIEGYISHTRVDFYIVGYSIPAPEAQSIASSGRFSPTRPLARFGY